METPENTNPVILGQFLDEIGGGSGGSSIVHPVNITIVNNTGGTPTFIPWASNSDQSQTYNGGFFVNDDGITEIKNNSGWIPTLEAGENTLPVAYCLEDAVIYIIDFMQEGYTYTLSGDVTAIKIESMDALAATGDCTITIS